MKARMMIIFSEVCPERILTSVWENSRCRSRPRQDRAEQSPEYNLDVPSKSITDPESPGYRVIPF